jgi:hypothetical protein
MWLPNAPFAEVHRIQIAAPAAIVFQHVQTLDFRGSWVTRLLFCLRGLPTDRINLAEFQQLRFTLLELAENQSLTLGLIGRFWKLTGDLQKFLPEEFESFDRPGFAKAIWSFTLLPAGDHATTLVTETRIACTDRASENRFRIYWWVIRPFSGWIRQEILRLIKIEAERLPA